MVPAGRQAGGAPMTCGHSSHPIRALRPSSRWDPAPSRAEPECSSRSSQPSPRRGVDCPPRAWPSRPRAIRYNLGVDKLAGRLLCHPRTKKKKSISAGPLKNGADQVGQNFLLETRRGDYAPKMAHLRSQEHIWKPSEGCGKTR